MRELADKVGTSAATIHRIESGKACDVETYLQLREWLAMPLPAPITICGRCKGKGYT